MPPSTATVTPAATSAYGPPDPAGPSRCAAAAAAADVAPPGIPERDAEPRPQAQGRPPASDAELVRRALLGRDLLGPAPGLLPFGPEAQARREARRQVVAEARRRRAALRDELVGERPAGTGAAWRPAGRRAHGAALISLTGVVLLTLGLGWWFADRPVQHDAPGWSPNPATARSASLGGNDPIATSSGAALAGHSASPPITATMSPRPPIPPGGVAPVTGTARPGLADAGSVTLVGPPSGQPTAEELSSPEAAMVAWLSRWCPFHHAEPFGTAEARARSAMTDAGWAEFNPQGHERLVASWQRTVAGRESGRCAVPSVLVSPEAPRTDTSAVVIATVVRMVSHGGGSYVELLQLTRFVLRGPDGQWRVDVATDGG